MGSIDEPLDSGIKSRIDHFIDDTNILINVMRLPESSIISQVRGDLRIVYDLCKTCKLNFHDYRSYFSERLKSCY